MNQDKYKCIKSYPGSPSKGTIIEPIKTPWNGLNYWIKNNYFDPKNYPEYWEKVVDEIKVGDYIWRVWPSGKKTLGIACAYSNSSYDHDNKKLKFTHFWSLENYNHEGGVRKNEGYGAIGSNNDYKYELATESEINKYLESIKPIFTTEDGYDVFEKEILYTVGFTQKVDSADYYQIATMNMAYTNKPNDEDYKWFKSREKATIWLEENKPQYSKKDMLNFGLVCRTQGSKISVGEVWDLYNIKK